MKHYPRVNKQYIEEDLDDPLVTLKVSFAIPLSFKQKLRELAADHDSGMAGVVRDVMYDAMRDQMQ